VLNVGESSHGEGLVVRLVMCGFWAEAFRYRSCILIDACRRNLKKESSKEGTLQT